jgi:hypothetical protein
MRWGKQEGFPVAIASEILPWNPVVLVTTEVALELSQKLHIFFCCNVTRQA